MRGVVFASGCPRGEGGQDPLFEIVCWKLLADQGREFESEAGTVLDIDGGMVMAGDDNCFWGEIGW